MADNLVLLDQYSFISKAERDRKLRSDDSFTTFRIDAKVIGGIGVFVVLLAVLGFLVWQTYGQAPKKAVDKPVISIQPAPAPATAVTPTPELSSVPATTAAVLLPVTTSQTGSASASAETILRVRVLAPQPTSEKNKALVARLEQDGLSVSLAAPSAVVPDFAEITTSTTMTIQQTTLLQRAVAEFYPNAQTKTSSVLQGIDAEVVLTE